MILIRTAILIFLEFSILLNAERISINFDDQVEPSTQCEPIKGECTDQGYSYTSKSHLNDGSKFANQKAADATIKSYELMKPCSAYLKIFICATYKPPCYEEAALIIQPCQSMCQHVYRMCFPLMQRFKMSWSVELNCSRFLDDSSENCMKDPGYLRDKRAQNDYLNQVDILLGKKFKPKQPKKLQKQNDVDIYSQYICYNKPSLNLNQHLNSKCSLRCHASIAFTSANKKFARNFTAIMSFTSICLLLVALIGITLDRTHKCHLSKFLALLSTCYLIYSMLIFVTIQLGTSAVICHKLDIKRLKLVVGRESPLSENPVLVEIRSYLVRLQNISENRICIVTLVLGYYFQTISLSLWTLMSFWWFLLVRFQIDFRQLKLGHVFYVAAFILPTIKTGLLLAKGSGGTSELTGLCSIENGNKTDLLNFVVLPYSLYLIAGLTLAAIAFHTILFTEKQSKVSHVVHEYKTAIAKFEPNGTKFISFGIAILILSLPFAMAILCETFKYVYSNKIVNLPSYVTLNTNASRNGLNEKEIFSLSYKNQDSTDTFINNDSFRILTINLIQILMSFLNGPILFTLFILNKSNKNIQKVITKQKSPNEVNIEQETYERSARISEIQNAAVRSNRPASDHIYYYPSYLSTSFIADKKRTNDNFSTFIRSDMSSLTEKIQRPDFRTIHK